MHAVLHVCYKAYNPVASMAASVQVFLVGDPIQLPATVISKRAVSYGYDISLFKRLQTAGYPVQVLDTQYRMHPDICRFPSNQFYGGGVKTGEGVAEATTRPWHAQKVSHYPHATVGAMHSQQGVVSLRSD